MITVYRYRVKSLNGLLNQMSRAVNVVWNFCNDSQKNALRWNKKWPSGYDLNNLTSGSCKELGLHSQSVQATCEQYAKSRKQHNKPYLRYRGKKTNGWVPLKGQALKRDGLHFTFFGKRFKVFNSRALPEGEIMDGTNFSQDSKGNWYLNITIEIPDAPQKPIVKPIGIDLGLKDLAKLSNGEKIENKHFTKQYEEKLAKAQRAHKKRQVTSIHAKIERSRDHYLHTEALKIAKKYDYIVVGDVSPSSLMQTNMAKSVCDASWSKLRRYLEYKAVKHGTGFTVVSEHNTTQTCSSCGAKPPERPRGIAGLGIRQWTCSNCGAEHDRDVNAALNILARSGHRTPVEGIPVL
jgi:IS605 OrfB family transposase